MTNSIVYRVTIAEISPDDETGNAPIYEQTVDQLDIKAVIDAVNGSPAKRTRAPRTKKPVEESVPAAA